MNQWIRNLAILLGLQVLIALALLAFGGGGSGDARVLASIEAEELAEFAIADGEGNDARLVKADDGWQLESGLPADDAKVTELLDKLTSLNAAWPVTESASAHARFEVDADNFQRRLTAGDAVLLFGTSPGYQQVHARNASDDAVYAVKLANHEMPADAEDWLDKGLLQPSGTITGVRYGDELALERGENGWQVGELEVSDALANPVLDRLRNLRVLGVAETEDDAVPETATAIAVSDADGELNLQFWKAAEDATDYLLRSSRYPDRAFRLASYVADQLTPELEDLREPEPGALTDVLGEAADGLGLDGASGALEALDEE
ncbi:MAG: DUF4340 domain-containing protein [Pseudomonadota bacterium]